jgi:hypothetical protein
MTPENQYSMLVDSVLLVASSPEEQVSYLPNFVVVTDEIVSTFGDAFLLVPQLERAGMISNEAVNALRKLEHHFERMRAEDTLADPATLRDHPFWEEARRLATEVLSALGEEKRPPHFANSYWLRG